MSSDRMSRILTERWRALLGLFGGILLPLLVFGALADAVWEREGFAWDAALLQVLHRHANPAFDTAMIRVTALGGPLPMAGVAALTLALLLAWRRRGDALFVALAVGGAATLNVLAKAVFQRSRPSLWPQLIPETDYGFPSGHAMGSLAVVATLLILLWPTRWRWPAMLVGVPFALLVGLSRVYLGVHYPSDILAGWSAALLWVVGWHHLRSLPLPRRAAAWRDAWFAARQRRRIL